MRVAVQPCGDSDAHNHYVDTISNLVNRDKIAPFLSPEQLTAFDEACGENVAVWGVTRGKTGQNLKQWLKLNSGDIVLLSKNRKLFSKARITYKIQNEPLAKALWSTKPDGSTWECIYFLGDLEEIDIPVSKYNEALVYDSKNIIQGFRVHEGAKAEKLIDLLEIPDDELANTEQETIPPWGPKNSLAALLASLDSLDYPAERKARAEMGIFREHLFGKVRTARCDICGKKYPVGFLVAAHIKKRASCNDAERRDLSVVMRACVLGCDALYERSYIQIDPDGCIKITLNDSCITDDIKAKIESISGRNCAAFSPSTEQYFEWHRTHPRRLLT